MEIPEALPQTKNDQAPLALNAYLRRNMRCGHPIREIIWSVWKLPSETYVRESRVVFPNASKKVRIFVGQARARIDQAALF